MSFAQLPNSKKSRPVFFAVLDVPLCLTPRQSLSLTGTEHTMSTNATDNADALDGFESDGSLGLDADPMQRQAQAAQQKQKQQQKLAQKFQMQQVVDRLTPEEKAKIRQLAPEDRHQFMQQKMIQQHEQQEQEQMARIWALYRVNADVPSDVL